jgi:hypothetical protein
MVLFAFQVDGFYEGLNAFQHEGFQAVQITDGKAWRQQAPLLQGQHAQIKDLQS